MSSVPPSVGTAYTVPLSQADELLLLSERLGFLLISTGSSPGASGASLVLQISFDAKDKMPYLPNTTEVLS